MTTEISKIETKTNVVSVNDENNQMMSLISKALTDPSITPEKLNGLLDFKLRLDRINAEKEASEAFARVVSKMPKIKKNGSIDFGKGQKPISYAKFEDLQEAIRPIYEEENFTVSYSGAPLQNGWSEWTATATHINGIKFSASIPLPLDTSGGKQNIQGMGSTSSYGMRYSTKALFNLRFEGEDDDGVRGDMKFLDAETMKQINTLLSDTGSDVTSFLRMFEVTEVQNLTKESAIAALNMLKTKKAALAKRTSK